jgi:hypothetical protein
MKYIVTVDETGTEDIFVFPKHIHHDAMAEMLEGIRNQTYGNWERIYRKPVAAGFINEKFECYGSSESLGVVSRKQDTQLLLNFLKK